MSRLSVPPSASFSRPHIPLLSIGVGGVAKVCVSAVTSPEVIGLASVVWTSSSGALRNTLCRPSSLPGRSGVRASSGWYVGSSRFAEASAPPLWLALPLPQAAAPAATVAAPVRAKRSRRRISKRIQDSLRGGAPSWDTWRGRDRSALDGAGDDALGEVLLEERVDQHDRSQRHDDDGHLDRLRRRGLLDTQLVCRERGALDHIAAQD